MNRFSLEQPRLQDGRKPYLIYLLAMVAAVGGFLFGYDLSIISGAMVFIQPAFNLNPHQVGLAMGSALLGCMAGPLVGGPLGDRWGRKRTLIVAGLLFAAGAVGTAMPSGVVSFSLFRFLGGVGIGLASVVSPMFIAEMSPPRIRGGLVTVNQLAIVVGGACAVVISYGLSFGEHWQWMQASHTALAMDAGLQRRPGAAVRHRSSADPRKPPLAGPERPARRGPGRAHADRRQ